MKNLLAVLLAAIALPATAAGAAVSTITISRMGTSTMELSCGASPVACHYLILKSLCQERWLADGSKEKTCQYSEAVPPFQLKPGETRTVANLPSDFLYTMKPGRAPTASECLSAPIPH